MRIPRIYVAELQADQAELALNAATSHYLCTVLRLAAGRELLAFDGRGHECAATLIHAHKKQAVIQVQGLVARNRESPLATSLGIGLSRGERFDWVLQKATELGATSITPLFTERTEVRLEGARLAKKTEQWQQIIIAACEQCQRNTLPELHSACDIADFCTAPAPALKLVLHHRSEQLLRQHPTPQAVTLLVGPEGGLTESEIAFACANGFQPLTLGPRVLRTETAPVAALAAVQLLWGDLG